MALSVYELYPVAGGFSNRTVDYTDTIVGVAAESNEQAHELAGRRAWAAGPNDPAGMLWVKRRVAGHDHELFNGAHVYGGDVQQVRHRATQGSIIAWMRDVLAE